MFDLRERPECVWPEDLKPIGYGGHYFELEEFPDWFDRNSATLSHLPSEVVEQWVYRHWHYSQYAFIPLETLQATEVVWSPDYFMRNVLPGYGDVNLNPDFDFDVFQATHGYEKQPTAVALDQGEWDYAPLVLETPNGFIDTSDNERAVKYLLIEGHQRRRYLNALLARGKQLADQRVIVLNSPLTTE